MNPKKTSITKAILGSALLLFAASAQAQTTYTWTGTVENNNTTATWEWDPGSGGGANWDQARSPGSQLNSATPPGAIDDIVVMVNNLGSGSQQRLRLGGTGTLDAGTIGSLRIGGVGTPGSTGATKLFLRNGSTLTVSGDLTIGWSDGGEREGFIGMSNGNCTLNLDGNVISGSTNNNNTVQCNNSNTSKVALGGDIDTAAARSGIDSTDAFEIDLKISRGVLDLTGVGAQTLNVENFELGVNATNGATGVATVGPDKTINSAGTVTIGRSSSKGSNRTITGTLDIFGGTVNIAGPQFLLGSIQDRSGNDGSLGRGIVNVGDGANSGTLSVDPKLEMAVIESGETDAGSEGVLTVDNAASIVTLNAGIDFASSVGLTTGESTATITIDDGTVTVNGPIETDFTNGDSTLNINGGKLVLLDAGGTQRGAETLNFLGGTIEFTMYGGMPDLETTDTALAATAGGSVIDLTTGTDSNASTTTLATWDGDTSLDWDTATNWDMDQLPSASAGLITIGQMIPLITSTNAMTGDLAAVVLGASDGNWTLTQNTNDVTVTRINSAIGTGVAKAVIDNGDTVARSGDLNIQNAAGQGADASELDVGSGGLTVTGDLILGGVAAGTVNQTGGTVTVTGDILAGAVGGNYHVDGGTLDVQGGNITVERFAVGETASSSGNYTVSNMNITTTGELTVGELGEGTLDLTDSVVVVGTGCFHAEDALAVANITLSGTTSLTSAAGEFRIAGFGDGTMTLSDTASISNGVGEFVIADDGTGTLNLGGASSLTQVGGNLEVAQNAGSTGELNMDSTGTILFNSNNLIVGQSVGSVATFSMSDGVLDLRGSDTLHSGDWNVNGGFGTQTISGGTIYVGDSWQLCNNVDPSSMSRTTVTGGMILVDNNLIYRAGGDDQIDLDSTGGPVVVKLGQDAAADGNLDMDDNSNAGPGGNVLTLRGHQVTLELFNGTTSELQCDGNSTINWELSDTGPSTIKVGGNVLLDGCVANFTHVGGTPPTGTHTLIDNLGAFDVSGTFAGLSDGAVFSIGSQFYQLSYFGGDGNDVTLSAVTDPLVSIAANGPVTEGGTASWTVSTPVAPSGYSITVGIVYSGTASDGSDFTGTASVIIPDLGTSGILNVSTSSDTVFEGCETIVAAIDSLTASTGTPTMDIGKPDQATVVMHDAASLPAASKLEQVAVGTGTVALGDIFVSDWDATYNSTVTTTNSAFYHFNGQSNVSTFDDGRADDDNSFDIDEFDPPLDDALGMSIEIAFIPQAADLTGTVLVWETGYTARGTSIVLVDGVLHLLSKAAGAGADFPTDDTTVTGAFNDLDWATDNTVVVPLTTTPAATVLTAGLPVRLAVDYDIVADTVKFSLNGSAEATATLLNNDSNDWNGSHATDHALVITPVGGATIEVGHAFENVNIKDLAGGTSAIGCVSFWNQSGTGVTATGAGTTDTITATLTILGWSMASDGVLSGLADGGSGVFSVSGNAGTVNAALAAMEFIETTATYPVTISVSITDGGTPSTGTIYIVDTTPDPIYVDDDFAGAFLATIADADAGVAGAQAAKMGVDAFDNIADALAAADPTTGTVIVNDGVYDDVDMVPVDVNMPDTQTLKITGVSDLPSGSTVTVGSLQAVPGNTIDLQANELIVGDIADTTEDPRWIDCPIIGAGGMLTKEGADRLVLRETCTYTGQTTINDGYLRLGHFPNEVDPLLTDYFGELAGDGPVVVNDPGVYEFNPNIDTVMNQTGAISGDGLVVLREDGTVNFDGPGANTFSGGIQLGIGGVSNWDGSAGSKDGFVVIGHKDHLGTGQIDWGGHQLQASVGGLVVPNDIIVNPGGFRFGGSNSLEMSGDILSLVAGSGTGNYGPDGPSAPVITLSGTITLEDPLASPINLAIEGTDGADNRAMVISGKITGAGTLSLSNEFDDGTLTVSNVTNDYSGTTTINAGTLLLNGTHTGGGAYNVNGGSLGGGGTTDAAVAANTGATVAPGASIGALTVGSLDLTGGGTLSIEVDNTAGVAGTDWDQLVVTGAVDVTGGTLEVLEVGAVVEVTPSLIVIVDTSVANTSPFAAGVPFSGDYLGSGRTGQVNYLSGVDSFDIALFPAGNSIIGTWRNGHWGSPANLAPGENTGNPESDSTDNLLEFGFGTNPTVADSVSLSWDGGVGTVVPGGPVINDNGGGSFSARFMRRQDAGQLGSASYRLEICSDLMDWEDLPIPGSPLVLDSITDYDLLDVTLPPTIGSGGVPRFLRIHVAEIVTP